jgi:hypothetical protein
MSSYSEFKNDVKGAAGGIVLALVLTLVFQVSFIIVSVVAILLGIGIYRLLGGKSKQTENEIKAGIIVLLGLIVIVAFSVWWYENMILPIR